jgi:hypothetical protein
MIQFILVICIMDVLIMYLQPLVVLLTRFDKHPNWNSDK